MSDWTEGGAVADPLPYPYLIDIVTKRYFDGVDNKALDRVLDPARQIGHRRGAARQPVERLSQVGDQYRQRSQVSQLIWTVTETIEHLSSAWELQPGDLIYTGTPAGVAAVVPGDMLTGGVTGLQTLCITIS